MDKKIELLHYLLDPDNTEKFVFQDENGILEIIRINTKQDRDIYCIPSMYECRLGCTMCYLTINNIKSSSKKIPYDSIEYCVKHILKNYSSNKQGVQISIMGVGDPQLNMELVEKLSEANWIDRLSVATIFPINKSFPHNVKIHYSLHSPIEEKRKKIIPNTNVSIESVIDYLFNYHQGEKEIHYTLIENTNDTDEELKEMIRIIPKGFTVKFLDFKTSYKSKLSKSNKVYKWMKELEKNGINTEFYYPPGEQIQGSCGLFTEGFYTDEKSEEFKLYLKKYEVKI